MHTAYADVSTDRPARYCKQLASHLGRKCTIDETADSTLITLPEDSADARCRLTPDADTLHLYAEGAGPDDLARVQEVVGGHLERFGEREELAVAWVNDN